MHDKQELSFLDVRWPRRAVPAGDRGECALLGSMKCAQTYFAVQTRKQETIEKRLLDVERVTAREKLSKSEKKLIASYTHGHWLLIPPIL